MFSPYYGWSGRRDPENHVAINVALYGAAPRWAMTERGASALKRDASTFEVGRSRMAWDGAALVIEIDETCAPLPERVRGKVRLVPDALCGQAFALDAQARHAWRPIAPVARVEAHFTAPQIAWAGGGYLDCNSGLEPLEAGFRRWTWSRAHHPGGAAQVFYDGESRNGETFALGLEFQAGEARAIAPAPMQALPRGFWGVRREARLDRPCLGFQAWEDTPFYTRTRVLTDAGETICESLDCDRLTNPIVRRMLPVRMPRRAR